MYSEQNMLAWSGQEETSFHAGLEVWSGLLAVLP